MSTLPANSISLLEADEVQVPPAAGQYTGSAPADPRARQAAMQRDGFLVLRNLVTPGELGELDSELQRLASSYRELQAVREGFNVERPEKWPDPQSPVFRKIGGIVDHSPAFRRLCLDRRLIEVLQQVMAERIRLWRDVVMMKQARVGREKPWHQDSVYWPWKPYRQVSAFIALDAMTPENGCLQVIPGSHLQALPHHGKESQVALSPEQQAQTLYVPLQAGDVLFFHGLLLHASEPNRSGRHRRVIIYSYMPADLEWTGKGAPSWPLDVA